MRIEDEIKQAKKFTNEYERLLVNLLFTASWIESKNIKRLKPFGISSQQYNVLRILRGASPKAIMLIEIATRMIDKNSNTSRLIDKLVSKGLANREISVSNRRQVDIRITEKGLNLLKEIDELSKIWLQEMKTLTVKEASNTNVLLDKLRSE